MFAESNKIARLRKECFLGNPFTSAGKDTRLSNFDDGFSRDYAQPGCAAAD